MSVIRGRHSSPGVYTRIKPSGRLVNRKNTIDRKFLTITDWKGGDDGEEKKIVKRYLLVDSSKHEEYDLFTTNLYPITLLESFINENDETIEFEGNTYYVWRGYCQRGDTSVEDIYYSSGGRYPVLLLTTSLNPNLPLLRDSEEFGYLILSTNEDKTDYIGNKYQFIAQVNEYNNGEKRTRMANVGVRLYNYNNAIEIIDHEHDYDKNTLFDYFQYDGEIVEYEGQKCYVWNRYDDGIKCPKVPEYFIGAQKFLTNTLWIKSLPFTMDSPEFVTWMNNDDHYRDEPRKMPFDRIEYLPDREYGIKRVLIYPPRHHRCNLSINEGYINENAEMVYFNGGYYYIWRKYEDSNGYDSWEYNKGEGTADGHGFFLLTNTLDIQLPFGEGSDEFEYYVDEGTDHYGTFNECIGLVKIYSDGRTETTFTNRPIELFSSPYDYYSYILEDYAHGDKYRYFGETIDWEGETCYLWSRYDSGQLTERSLEYGDKTVVYMLTNTLWINLPFNENSPEYVTRLTADGEEYTTNEGQILNIDSQDINIAEYLGGKVFSGPIKIKTFNLTPPQPQEPPIEKIQILYQDSIMHVGDSQTISCHIDPYGYHDFELISSNNSVINITPGSYGDSQINAIGAGVAHITIIAHPKYHGETITEITEDIIVEDRK